MKTLKNCKWMQKVFTCIIFGVVSVLMFMFMIPKPNNCSKNGEVFQVLNYITACIFGLVSLTGLLGILDLKKRLLQLSGQLPVSY